MNNHITSLKTLERQIKSACTDLSKLETEAECTSVVIGKLLIKGQEIYAKVGGFKLPIKLNSSGFQQIKIGGLSFKQWAISTTGRSYQTCTTYMYRSRHPERRLKTSKVSSEINKLGRSAMFALRLGVPVVDLSTETRQVRLVSPEIARSFRVSNAIAVILSLSLDEYEEVMLEVAKARKFNKAA